MTMPDTYVYHVYIYCLCSVVTPQTTHAPQDNPTSSEDFPTMIPTMKSNAHHHRWHRLQECLHQN